MYSQEDIAGQQQLLHAHRQTLAHYLHQRALLGPAHISPGVANGINESRQQLRRIKATLRGWGVAVDDHPSDNEENDTLYSPQESQKQISKIMEFTQEYELPNYPSEEQAEESLKAIARQIHSLLGYAFLDTCEISPFHSDFVYLLSFNPITQKDGSITLYLGLICHITPFVSAFDEIISILFNKSDQEFLARTSKYPSDLNIKFSYEWAANVPYRITRIGPKAIRVECLNSNHFTVKFPLKTSDLLVIISAMMNGKPVVYDDVNLSGLRPNEVEFIKYTSEAKHRGTFNLSDFTIDVSNPELWSVTTKGVQRDKR